MPDMHTFIIIKTISCMHEHHAEDDAEESRCHDTTLHHAASDGKGLRQVTIESDLATLVLIELDHIYRKLMGQTRKSHNPVLLIESKDFLRSTIEA